MSGYRQSSFDPTAYEQAGRPLRPFNWVQWTGVALESAGIVLFLVDIAEKIGWLGAWAEMPSFAAIFLMLIGLTLINSRREPSTIVGPEQQAANRRLAVITVAICAAVLGVATFLSLQGS